MNVSPIDAVTPVARVNAAETVQQPSASLLQQQDLFEQLMMQNGLSMLDASRGGNAGNEDEEA